MAVIYPKRSTLSLLSKDQPLQALSGNFHPLSLYFYPECEEEHRAANICVMA